MSLLPDRLEEALEAKVRDPSRAIAIFKEIIHAESAEEEGVKAQENAIYALGELYVEQRRAAEIKTLLTEIRPFFASLPKARTAKIVRTLIDLVEKIPGTADLQIELCKDSIEWCKQEKRTFLRLRVETRLAALYLEQKKFHLGLELLQALTREVKRLDDKLLLVEIHLVESKLHFQLRNIAKAKAALTAARTNANAIHCPPLLQADIDLQSGVLHAQERDYKTSFSYFYEAFEAFNVHAHDAQKDKPLQALKYMLLAKIMCNQADEVNTITAGKNGMKYVGPDVEALRVVAKCHKQRSLKMFEQALKDFHAQLKEDPILQFHINALYETLVEQNLQRIVEPFSRVEITHVAKLIDLPLQRVQSKLSEMILDGKLLGTLDQGVGVLVLFAQPPLRATYEDSVATIKNMSQVVDSLYEKAQTLN